MQTDVTKKAILGIADELDDDTAAGLKKMFTSEMAEELVDWSVALGGGKDEATLAERAFITHPEFVKETPGGVVFSVRQKKESDHNGKAFFLNPLLRWEIATDNMGALVLRAFRPLKGGEKK